MFINISNHPSDKWSPEQRSAAEKYGEIVDMPFPAVDPDMDEKGVAELADKYFHKVIINPDAAVMLQGEFTFVFSLAVRLIREGIPVLAACSERRVTTVLCEDGTEEKRTRFVFVRFRQYQM